MADVPRFVSPVTRSAPTDDVSELEAADESAMGKVVVRAAPDGPAATAIGVAFGSSRRDGDVLVCGQRPGEWVLLGPGDAVAALVGTLDTSGHVSVIDDTHGRALFRLTGGCATSALEKICSVDWSDPMTPNGAVVSASVAKVDCDIVRDDVEGTRSYLIACERAVGQYLFDVIVDASAEFGLGVAG